MDFKCKKTNTVIPSWTKWRETNTNFGNYVLMTKYLEKKRKKNGKRNNWMTLPAKREKTRVRGAYDKFSDFFRMGIWNCCRLLKIRYVNAKYFMRWQINFYDFRFKWTATAGFGIHPTKAWLSQLANFKNTIWTWGRTICNKIVF